MIVSVDDVKRWAGHWLAGELFVVPWTHSSHSRAKDIGTNFVGHLTAGDLVIALYNTSWDVPWVRVFSRYGLVWVRKYPKNEGQ